MHGRLADLVVAGQYDSNDPESFISKNFAETLVVNTGRPILFLPYSGVFQDVGRHVLIGWNASQYATRSIHDAMPFLRHARQVEIACVRGRGDPTPEIHGPGTDIGTTLARNEVRATLRDIVEHVDRPICDVLLSEAQRIGADLIAMGGYGHTRWRDVVLGGVTRDMLRAMPLPVLMSH
nr:universal stress protein [Caballeronia sp. BR00000012568055]